MAWVHTEGGELGLDCAPFREGGEPGLSTPDRVELGLVLALEWSELGLGPTPQ